MNVFIILLITAAAFAAVLMVFVLETKRETKRPVITEYTVACSTFVKGINSPADSEIPVKGNSPADSEIPVEGINSPADDISVQSNIRLVFLSDLHGHFFKNDSRDFYKAVLDLKPDLVLIGGDMMTVKSWAAKDMSALEGLLCALEGLPVYYADGNHEQRMEEEAEAYPGWYREFCALLKKYRVHYLKNSSETVLLSGRRLNLYGMDFDQTSYKTKFRTPALSAEDIEKHIGAPGKGCNIVLAHSPFYLNAFASWGADLVLSGHLHGGTIRLPRFGGLMTPQFQFFSKFSKGMLKEKNTTEIVSAGLGTHSINLRVNNRPEIVAIEIPGKENT